MKSEDMTLLDSVEHKPRGSRATVTISEEEMVNEQYYPKPFKSIEVTSTEVPL